MWQGEPSLWSSPQSCGSVVSGLVDMMAEDIDDGRVFRWVSSASSATIRAKSADDEKEVSSKSIVQRKILSILENIQDHVG